MPLAGICAGGRSPRAVPTAIIKGGRLGLLTGKRNALLN